jgi:hypothetical protein
MEYVRLVTGKNGHRFEYELLFDGDLNTSAPQRMGLIDVEALRTTHPESDSTTPTSQGQTPHLAPGLQAARTVLVGTSQSGESSENLGEIAVGGVIDAVEVETARRGSVSMNGHSHSVVARAPVLSSLLAADRDSVTAAASAG